MWVKSGAIMLAHQALIYTCLCGQSWPGSQRAWASTAPSQSCWKGASLSFKPMWVNYSSACGVKHCNWHIFPFLNFLSFFFFPILRHHLTPPSIWTDENVNIPLSNTTPDPFLPSIKKRKKWRNAPNQVQIKYLYIKSNFINAIKRWKCSSHIMVF